MMPLGRGFAFGALTVAIWTFGEMLSMPLIEDEATLDTSGKTEREPLAVLTGVRTPLAKAFGALAEVPADELGRIAVEKLLAGHGGQPAPRVDRSQGRLPSGGNCLTEPPLGSPQWGDMASLLLS